VPTSGLGTARIFLSVVCTKVSRCRREEIGEPQPIITCSRRHAGSSTVSRLNLMLPCDDHAVGRISGEERPHVGGSGRSKLCLCVRPEVADAGSVKASLALCISCLLCTLLFLFS
jgi:hypothetical protein